MYKVHTFDEITDRGYHHREKLEDFLDSFEDVISVTCVFYQKDDYRTTTRYKVITREFVSR